MSTLDTGHNSETNQVSVVGNTFTWCLAQAICLVNIYCLLSVPGTVLRLVMYPAVKLNKSPCLCGVCILVEGDRLQTRHFIN